MWPSLPLECSCDIITYILMAVSSTLALDKEALAGGGRPGKDAGCCGCCGWVMVGLKSSAMSPRPAKDWLGGEVLLMYIVLHSIQHYLLL